MIHDDIRTLYHNADYSKPKLLQVLADVAGITMDELKQIIKEGDENIMPKGTRWTPEQHQIYNRMTAENAKACDIAKAMGVPAKAVYAKQYAKGKQGKPATINEDFDAEFPVNDKYADCDVKFPINAKIAQLCELPDPIHAKADYTESLLETLRETIEDLEKVNYIKGQAIIETNQVIHDQYHTIEKLNETICKYQHKKPASAAPSPAKPRTIFDIVQKAGRNLKQTTAKSNITPEWVTIEIDSSRITATAGNKSGDNIKWYKTYLLNEQ